MKWDAKLQRAKGRSEIARTLNEYLDSIENTVKKEFNWLLDNGKDITASVLRDIFNGENKRENFLVLVFELNNQLIEQEEGGKYTRSTIDQYKTTLTRLKKFLDEEYNCTDVALNNLDWQLKNEELFLKVEIPVGTKAEIPLPQNVEEYKINRKSFVFNKYEHTVIGLQSGKYSVY